MCGIVGYVGTQKSVPILIKGLKRLEYRGYDSAGVALLDEKIHITKKKGKVAALAAALTEQQTMSEATTGIGHTRWATHGAPSDKNAHPLCSNSQKLAIVHNGIIENYSALKKKLLEEGYVFHSDTDSEVLVNLIESIQKQRACDLEEAVLIALKLVVGTYVILLLESEHPGRLIAARNGSPLVVGVGKHEHILASDAAPIAEFTQNVVYVNDHELIIVSKDELVMKNFNNEKIVPEIQKLELEMSEIEKGGYPFFMLKEICEQPQSIANCLRGRISKDLEGINLGGLQHIADKLKGKKRVVFIACGTSLHAAWIASYAFARYAKMQTLVEYASEFNYKDTLLTKEDMVIVISQSGETMDTLMAVHKAKKSSALVLGLVNVVGSSIARAVEAGCYCHAGPEIGVASTKAFTTQVVVLNLMCLYIAQLNGHIDLLSLKPLLSHFESLPKQAASILAQQAAIKKLASKHAGYKNFLFIGRGVHFPVALEGALKLKEISYLNAQGYPAGELKHGPIALIDESMITIGILSDDPWKEKTLSNLKEVKARAGKTILVVDDTANGIDEIADEVILVPKANDLVSPILNIIPLQLFAYHISTALGLDVDQPRNLAKSVTVE